MGESGAMTSRSDLHQRIYSIDLLRGLVIVIMALDHVRDFFSPMNFMPEDLGQTNAALFVTRWVTHFCAPVFVLLAGTSAYLHGQRLGDRAALSRFLLSRGLWLIALELLVVNPTWMGGIPMAFGQVIWALGWCMVVLAALVWLPRSLILLFGALLVLGHNALDDIQPQSLGSWAWLWQVLHVPGWIPLTDNPRGYGFWVAYPLVPWLGVIALGYVIGPWFEWPGQQRRRVLAITGACALLAFLLLRGLNLYGDASLWDSHRNGVLFTLFSFLNTTKYPPSLLFLLMTLGPALLLLALWDRRQPGADHALLVFGQVPLFFYLLHIPLIHACAWVYMNLRFGAHVNMMAPHTWPADYQAVLWITYPAWIALLVLLYFICRWYRSVKMRNRDSLLRFL